MIDHFDDWRDVKRAGEWLLYIAAIAYYIAMSFGTAAAQEPDRDALIDQMDEMRRLDKLAERGEAACDRGIKRSGELGERLSKSAAAVEDISGTVKDWKARSNFDPMLLVYAALGLTGVGGGAVVIRKLLKGPQAILAALADHPVAQQPGNVPPGQPFRGDYTEAQASAVSSGPVRGARSGGGHGAHDHGRVAHGSNGGNGSAGMSSDGLDVAAIQQAHAKAQGGRG